MRKAVLTWLFTALAVSCSPGPEDWLARSDCGAVTLAEASAAWSQLDEAGRDYFLRSGSPGEEFVSGIAMLDILKAAAVRNGYTADPAVVSFRNSWLRTESFIAWSALKHDELVSGFTGEELRFLAEHSADTVRLTLFSPGRRELDMGFLRLSEIPPEPARALLEIPVGSSIPFRDGSLRLNSILRGEPSPFPPDSVLLWSCAQGRLRFMNLADDYLAREEYGISIDTLAVHRVSRYFAGSIQALPGDTVLSSSLLTVTAEDLARELEFFQTRLPVNPGEPMWAMMTVDNLIIQTLRMNQLAVLCPALMDSLEAGADDFALETAVSAMYADSVTAMLSLDEEAVLDEYRLLEEPVVIPEKRVLLALHIPEDSAALFFAALEDGGAEEIARSLEGLPFLFREGPVSRVTPPLAFQQLPYGHREPVFDQAPGDTSWVGPLEMEHMPGLAVYRVLEVIPEHTAEPWEIMPLLRRNAMVRAEDARAEQWMQGMKDEFNLRVNRRALGKLPSDPGLWAAILPER